MRSLLRIILREDSVNEPAHSLWPLVCPWAALAWGAVVFIIYVHDSRASQTIIRLARGQQGDETRRVNAAARTRACTFYST